MTKLFSKKYIDNYILSETKGYYILNKSDLYLREDLNNGNAYVEPSSDNVSSLSSDLSKTKTENPTDDTFVVNANSYDGNSSNDTVTLDVHGSNPAEASQNFQRISRNPSVKNLMANTNVNAKIHLKNENIEKLRESSVPFSKKEIMEMLNDK